MQQRALWTIKCMDGRIWINVEENDTWQLQLVFCIACYFIILDMFIAKQEEKASRVTIMIVMVIVMMTGR